MATITYNDRQLTFSHPTELQKLGHPPPPLQPIASYAQELARFQALCNADDFAGAVAYLAANHMCTRTDDVPAPKLTAFKNWVIANKWSMRTTGYFAMTGVAWAWPSSSAEARG